MITRIIFPQGFVDQERDFVFSPLGYSVVLAILAEGARGRSRNQLVEALGLPEDTYAVRQNYKTILSAMRVMYKYLLLELRTDIIS